MKNAGLEEAQAGIKIARRNINNLRYADGTTFMAESEEELKSHEVMGPDVMITSWQIIGETVKTVPDFIYWSSKITADGDCSHEIKRLLLLGRKVMTNLITYSKAETLLCQQRSV